MNKLQRLRDLGFDESHNVPFTSLYRVKCSQCEALTINGIACHEHGCTNKPRVDNGEENDDC